MFKRSFHRGESDVLPGYLLLVKKLDLEGFNTCRKFGFCQLATEKHINLIDVGNVYHAVEFQRVQVRVSLFHTFAHGAFEHGFAVLHEACRQSPIAVSRFNGTPAEQYLIFKDGNATSDDARVLIMYGFTTLTNVAVTIVSFGDAVGDGSAATTAVFQGTGLS